MGTITGNCFIFWFLRRPIVHAPPNITEKPPIVSRGTEIKMSDNCKNITWRDGTNKTMCYLGKMNVSEGNVSELG